MANAPCHDSRRVTPNRPDGERVAVHVIPLTCRGQARLQAGFPHGLHSDRNGIREGDERVARATGQDPSAPHRTAALSTILLIPGGVAGRRQSDVLAWAMVAAGNHGSVAVGLAHARFRRGIRRKQYLFIRSRFA
jgi:hypothetical protein